MAELLTPRKYVQIKKYLARPGFTQAKTAEACAVCVVTAMKVEHTANYEEYLAKYSARYRKAMATSAVESGVQAEKKKSLLARLFNR